MIELLKQLLSNPAFIITGGVLLGIAIPVILVIMFRKSGNRSAISSLPRAIDQVRAPWREEEQNLQELADLVKNFKQEDPDGANINKH
jgi:hypothetical protein